VRAIRRRSRPVAKSLQPVIRVSAAVGKPTSGNAGSGTKFAQADEPLPDKPGAGPSEGVDTPSQPVKPLPAPLSALEPDTPEAERGPGSAAAKPDAPPAKAPDTNPAAAVKGKGGRPVPRARVTSNGRIHILSGNKRGGGHRAGTGKAGKSEFPASWSDDKIIAEIESVANDPDSKRSTPDKRGKIEVEGSRDGVDLLVVLSKDGRTIITAYPTNLPPNPQRGK
jgi:hypothetical protein